MDKITALVHVRSYRAYTCVAISIVIALCVSISYMSGGPKLPSEQQKNKDKVINRLVYATIGVLGVGILYAFFTMRGGKLSTGYNIKTHSTNFICYIWFFVIYTTILMGIVAMILKITKQIDVVPTDATCLLEPNYKIKNYKQTRKDVNGNVNVKGNDNDIAPVLDFRFNQIDTIKVNYINDKPVFAKRPKNDATNQSLFDNAVKNIENITVTYKSIGRDDDDSTKPRTCVFKNDKASCKSMCKLYQHISGLSGVQDSKVKDCGTPDYTCPIGQ